MEILLNDREIPLELAWNSEKSKNDTNRQCHKSPKNAHATLEPVFKVSAIQMTSRSVENLNSSVSSNEVDTSVVLLGSITMCLKGILRYPFKMDSKIK